MKTPNAPSTVDPQVADEPVGPVILRLEIERFRGIEQFDWRPERGVNVILGGGDVGKTTILDAIALLLAPTNSTAVADSDYFARRTESGFSIGAVMVLPSATGIDHQYKPSWPWLWNGADAEVPNTDGEGQAAGDLVYWLRVRGTEDLELAYEIVQPDGTTDALTVGLRRSIGLVRLGGDDRNDRDLRLVYGSALDRLLSDKSLRSRVASRFSDSEVTSELSESATTALSVLDGAFKRQHLPSGLSLSLTGGPGASIASMIGLTAARNGVQLPLTSWGAGTRRLAALEIAEQNQGAFPITVVDEVERGLEPYRQRTLMEQLQNTKSQVFVTTHSPFAIAATPQNSLWYADVAGKIGPLHGKKVSALRARDPAAFLSRLTIMAEGATEVGFVSVLLERALGGPLEHHGLHVCDGGGNESTLDLLQVLSAAGMRFGGFADNEGTYPTRWQQLGDSLGAILFRWEAGCIEENIVRVASDAQLKSLVEDPSGGLTGMRLRSLADRLGLSTKDFDAIRTSVGAGLRALIIDAALGKVPIGKESEEKEFKRHAQIWFKTEVGGRELAEKVFSMDLWSPLKPTLLPFCCAVRTTVGLSTIADISS